MSIVYSTTCPAYTQYKAEPEVEGVPKWSGKAPPPPLGATVRVRMNNLGLARVAGYAVVEGFLALHIALLDAPEWHRKQNKGDPRGIVFGAEIEPIE